MGVRRTFQTEAERDAFITGYSDGINTACATAKVCAAASEGVGAAMVAAALRGLVTALEDHERAFVAEQRAK